SISAWATGDRRLFAYAEQWWQVPIDSWLIPARLTIALLGLLLGALVYRWTADWFGTLAGLLALALLAFDPNILAHAQLATLDLGVTLLILSTLYIFQRTLNRARYASILINGALLGLALSAKISASLLVPITGGLLLIWGWLHWTKKELFLKLLLYSSAAFLTLWGVHLFQIGMPLGINISLPAPTFWRSFLRIGRDVSSVDRPAFLLGKFYRGGRWYYFPVVFLLKTPLPTLLLLIAALSKLWRQPWSLWRLILWGAFPLSYSLVSVTTNINIGYRHILPLLPFLYIGIGSLASRSEAPSAGEGARCRSVIGKKITHYTSRYALPALLLWQCGGTLAVAPYHLTFFNELVGGPANGWRYLSDSNVDWNQGLKATRAYLDSHVLEDVYLSVFTQYLPPEIYGLEETIPLPPYPEAPPVMPARYNPLPGTYIISASTLRGISITLTETYNWFCHREPDDIIANSMLVYHVAGREPRPTWVAQCNLPVTPLSAEMLQNRFWRSDLRQLDFDCTQSWLYPGNGLESGWVALHRELLPATGDFLQRQLSLLNLSFEQATAHAAPPHSIYEWQPLTLPLPTYRPYHVAAAATPPAQLTASPPLTESLALDGPLDFLGYEIRATAPPEIITYWRVTAVPEAPFSLMAHLITSDGQTLEVVDGLGVTWHQLRPGDVLAQRHLFTVQPAQPSSALYLRTGAYWLAEGVRWPRLANPNADSIFIPLATK
ncbi:MAG: glycosyltransferase family 39 protein, partial [Chloroflexota bacterium]|nr:glycosyltransferase family 39 protein [Chloroflexota bacterium]